MSRKGIDVSSYQGIIDWKKVAASGVDFAILKIMRKDLSPDKRFENNWAGCLAAGVPIKGVYNYSYATTIEKARVDAAKVIEILAGRKSTVYLDAEDDCLKGLGEKLADIINAYGGVIEAAGLPFGVYTGLSFYNNYIRPYADKIKYPFWGARYPSGKIMTIEQDPDESKKPDFLHALVGWQYSSKGSVPGISGNVDLNIWYGDLPDQAGKDNDTEPVIDEEAVKSLQEALNADDITDENGKKLVIDGKKGGHTTAAIKKVLLKAGAFNTSTARYGVGSTGEVVKWMQMRLNSVIGAEIVKLTGSKYGLNPDGKLGNDTRLAVGLFQEIRGLKVDYVAGVDTITELLMKG